MMWAAAAVMHRRRTDDADLCSLRGPVDREAVSPGAVQHTPPPIFRPPPCSRSRAIVSPDRRRLDLVAPPARRDLHASGSYDPRDTPAAFKKAKDVRHQQQRQRRRHRALEISPKQAYDDLEAGAEAEGPGPADEAPAEEPLASDDRPRDKVGPLGRQSTETPAGRSNRQPPARSSPEARSFRDPVPPFLIQLPRTAPRSNQAPEHWSAEDKATFAKLPQEGQAFLLKRHGEMEAEFTRKSQASAGAVQFTQSLAPVFTDRRIQASLQQMGLNPTQADPGMGRLARPGDVAGPAGQVQPAGGPDRADGAGPSAHFLRP